MRIRQLSVQNFRGLRDVTIPMSHFGCLIGENNSGKSSVLQALSLFVSGSKLQPVSYFDTARDIRIVVEFVDITDEDLRVLEDEHRTRLKNYIADGKLTLVRRYQTDGTSRLRATALVPRESRFEQEAIDLLVKGKRPGTQFSADVVAVFPELANDMATNPNIGQVRDFIARLASALPPEAKELREVDLPSGIDNSIRPLLPEPIYIPAVRDLMDDVKAKESTSFGKLIGILFRAVEAKLADERELFERLNAKLNRVVDAGGAVQDNRLDELKLVESTVETLVRESFPAVSLKINVPPPEVRSILQTAQVLANDGIEGTIDTKGDGLKRAVAFAILRAYVDLNRTGLGGQQGDIAQPRYLFLFEEPELYLHPRAQRILFETLGKIANRHFVVVSTHSPLFFWPGVTATFTRLEKTHSADIPRPYTVAHPIDLSDVSAKDQFQMICFENNSAAFFSNTVVLVEGDSDYIVWSHLAKTINPDWECSGKSVSFVRINGKGSIRRYRDFFRRFGTRVLVISDLDLLVRDFAQVDPSEELRHLQSTLMQTCDEVARREGRFDRAPTAERIRQAHATGSVRALGLRVVDLLGEIAAGRMNDTTVAQTMEAVEGFLEWTRTDARTDVLQSSTDEALVAQKRLLLMKLRELDVFVLDKGALESYYPDAVCGADKPAKAQHLCELVTNRDAALGLCGDLLTNENGSTEKEFMLLFRSIFGPE